MDLGNVIVLSIVEGITEFLPISSTGHLILVSNLLKIPQTEFVKSFEIIIQLGAILSVVFLYRNSLIKNTKVWKNIIAGFIPTASIGFLLYKLIKGYLIGNSMITVIALLIGGIFLILIEKYFNKNSQQVEKIEDLSIKQSIIIGLGQSISVIPGVSRSAATIISAMLLGAKRKPAVEFSFLLAIPTMFAATGLDLLEMNFSFTQNEWMMLALGMLISFTVALIVVKWFIKYVQNNDFTYFGIYRIIIALLFLMLLT